MKEKLNVLLDTMIDEYEGKNLSTEKIADYLIQNGVVVLPCKVGDVAYIIINESEKFGGSYVEEEKIVEVSTAGRIWTDKCYYDDDDIGKTVFLSREEAEKKLKERENETKT